MGKKLKVAISFGIVVLALGWVVISGFDEANMQYYVSINEVKAMPAQNLNQALRVKGKLVSGSLVEDATTLQKEFRIAESGAELAVRYNGLLPDTFKEGAEVLVEGKYTSDGYFVAQTVLAKCPSKYETTETYDQQQNYQTGTASDKAGTN